MFGVCLISEGISFLLPFPFPAGVISLVLLLLLLFSGVVKERHIGRVSGFLVDNMAFFFVPPCVAIMEHWEKLLPYLAPLPFYCRSHHPPGLSGHRLDHPATHSAERGERPVRDILFSSPFFGIVLTCAAWSVAQWIQKRTGCFLLNPLAVAVALILSVLAALRVPYEDYQQGGDVLSLLLGQ